MLTAKQNIFLTKLLHQLDNQSIKPTNSRRRHPRLNLRIPLEITLLKYPNFTTLEVYTRNISVSGIGLLSSNELPMNDFLVIPLCINKKAQHLVLGQVVFCRQLIPNLYEVGVKFKACTKEGDLNTPLAWYSQAMLLSQPPDSL